MRALLHRPAAADTALPVIGANASAETLALFRYLRWLKGRPEIIWGVSDRHDVQAPMGALKGSRAAFTTQTGRVPVILQLEYHDSDWVTGYTDVGYGLPSAGPATVAAEISAALTAGVKAIAVNAHMGNPATGALSRQGQDGVQDGRAGYQNDRSGSPMASIKSVGGAQYAQFTAWLDRFYDWASALVFPAGHAHAGARVPIILRLFHECSGASFWWAGTDRAADHKTVWQEAGAYLKAKSPALTNVLFAQHFDSVDSAALASWTSWYPGASYIDVISWSRYNDGTGPVGLNDAGTLMDQAYANAQALDSTKIYAVMETGYANDNTADLWSTRVGDVAVSRYPMLSFYCTWRPASITDLTTVKWGPGSADSAARKASAAAAVRNANIITAERCLL